MKVLSTSFLDFFKAIIAALVFIHISTVLITIIIYLNILYKDNSIGILNVYSEEFCTNLNY